jgi:hypothetical protein
MTEPTRVPGKQGRILAGIVLVLIGGFLLLDRFLPEIDLWALWPVLLIVAGAGIILRARQT